MKITEPATMITDYILAAEGALFAVWLWDGAQGAAEAAQQAPQAAAATSLISPATLPFPRYTPFPADLAAPLWALAFAGLAAGAIVGGTVHGFTAHLSPRARDWLWKTSLAVIGGSGAAMAGAVVVAAGGGSLGGWLIAALVVKLALYLAWIARHDEFRWAVYDYSASMALIVALAAWAIVQAKSGGAAVSGPAAGGLAAGAPWIIAGVLLSALGSVVQRKGIGLHRHFNHNDVYHVIQMVALYLLFRGAWLQTGG